ncbi:MAG TPA: diacylglycerol kinase family protein [Flavipsychrobacter sp.]|nr:diacylglycerol kinase family protein [Flavipsychrobacter sp.]
MEKIMIVIQSRLSSLGFAWQGVQQCLWNEPNMRIHLVTAVLVLVAAWHKRVSRIEWFFIVFAIAFVLATEILNTCIEKLCDLYVGNRMNPQVRMIKDMAAAAVLLAATTTIIVAAVIFLF